jgi:hypothetical protein
MPVPPTISLGYASRQMSEIILVKDLPSTVVDIVVRELMAYTVAFLRVDRDATNPPADLLGSGVLVSAGPKRAILTAHHVVQALPTRARIGLFLGRTNGGQTKAKVVQSNCNPARRATCQQARERRG